MEKYIKQMLQEKQKTKTGSQNERPLIFQSQKQYFYINRGFLMFLFLPV
jgi:hypothetical protein